MTNSIGSNDVRSRIKAGLNGVLGFDPANAGKQIGDLAGKAKSIFKGDGKDLGNNANTDTFQGGGKSSGSQGGGQSSGCQGSQNKLQSQGSGGSGDCEGSGGCDGGGDS